MYSRYQANKHGLISRYYTELDVNIYLNKIKRLERLAIQVPRTSELALKKVELYKKNVEFLCRMINQQAVERIDTFFIG